MEKELNVKNIKEKSKGFLNEFKKFITKGNAIDLAVGVIIGSAFAKIVSSIVDDILMPIIGAIIGGIDFTSLSITIGNANIKYGNFINNIVDFIIIAFFIFLFVKLINKIGSKKEVEENKKQVKSEETKLLEQILVELKNNNNKK